MNINDFDNDGYVTKRNPDYDKKHPDKNPELIRVPDVSPDRSAVLDAMNYDIMHGYNIDKETNDEWANSGYNYNTWEDLNIMRAHDQGNWVKARNALGQTIISELLLGTLKAGVDLLDLTLNKVFNIGDDYHGPLSGISDLIQQGQDYLNDKGMPVYTDPNYNIDNGGLSRFEWWMKNVPQIASAFTLMIPAKAAAAGVAKIANVAAKYGKATKLGGAIVKNGDKAKRWLARNNAKAANFFFNPKTVARRNALAQTMTEATMMRLMENYQEAKDVYKPMYDDAAKKFNEMNDEEFNQFITNTKDFENVTSRDEAAKLVASKAADRTYSMDLANIVFDVIQLHALKNIGVLGRGKNDAWGKTVQKAQRESINSAKQVITGAAQTIKPTSKFFTFRNGLVDFAKGNFKVALAESTEALEEGINFVAQQEGITYGKALLDNKDDEYGKYGYGSTYYNLFSSWTNMQTPMSEYLKDPQMHESMFWGLFSGWLFAGGTNIANNIQQEKARRKNIDEREASEKITADKAKAIRATYTFFDYFDAPQNKFARVSMAMRNGRLKNLADNIKAIKDGYNVLGESKNGVYDKFDDLVPVDDSNLSISQQLAIEQVKNQFVKDLTLDAIDNSCFDLTIDFLNSKEVKEAMVEGGISTKEDIDADTEHLVNMMKQIDEAYTKQGDIVIQNATIANQNRADDNQISFEYIQNIARQNIESSLHANSIQNKIDQLNTMINDKQQTLINNSSDKEGLRTQFMLDREMANLTDLSIRYNQAKDAIADLESKIKASKNPSVGLQMALKRAKKELDSTIKDLEKTTWSNLANPALTLTFAELNHQITHNENFDFETADEEIVNNISNTIRSYDKTYTTPESIQTVVDLANTIRQKANESYLINKVAKLGLMELYHKAKGLELQKNEYLNSINQTPEDISDKANFLDYYYNKNKLKVLEKADDILIKAIKQIKGDAKNDAVFASALTALYNGNKNLAIETIESILPNTKTDSNTITALEFTDALDIFNSTNYANTGLYEHFLEIIKIDTHQRAVNENKATPKSEANDAPSEDITEKEAAIANTPTINDVTTQKPVSNVETTIDPFAEAAADPNAQYTDLIDSNTTNNTKPVANLSNFNTDSTITIDGVKYPASYVNNTNDKIEVSFNDALIANFVHSRDFDKLFNTKGSVTDANVDLVVTQNPIIDAATGNVVEKGLIEAVQKGTAPSPVEESANETQQPVEPISMPGNMNIFNDEPIVNSNSSPKDITSSTGEAETNVETTVQEQPAKSTEFAYEPEYDVINPIRVPIERAEQAKEYTKKYAKRLKKAEDAMNNAKSDDEADEIAREAKDELFKSGGGEIANYLYEIDYGWDGSKFNLSIMPMRSIGTNWTASEINKLGNFRVGDTIQVYDNIRSIPGTVTKVDEKGRIVSAVDFDGRILIENYDTLTFTERLEIENKLAQEMGDNYVANYFANVITSQRKIDSSNIVSSAEEAINSAVPADVAKALKEDILNDIKSNSEYRDVFIYLSKTEFDINYFNKIKNNIINILQNSINLQGRINALFNELSKPDVMQSAFDNSISAYDNTFIQMFDTFMDKYIEEICEGTPDIVDGKIAINISNIMYICNEAFQNTNSGLSAAMYTFLTNYLQTPEMKAKYLVIDTERNQRYAAAEGSNLSDEDAQTSETAEGYRINFKDYLDYATKHMSPENKKEYLNALDGLNVGDKLEIRRLEGDVTTNMPLMGLFVNGVQIGSMRIPNITTDGGFYITNKGFVNNIKLGANNVPISATKNVVINILTSDVQEFAEVRGLVFKYISTKYDDSLSKDEKTAILQNLGEEFINTTLIDTLYEESANEDDYSKRVLFVDDKDPGLTKYEGIEMLDYLASLYTFCNPKGTLTAANNNIVKSIDRFYKKEFMVYQALYNAPKHGVVSVLDMSEGNLIRLKPKNNTHPIDYLRPVRDMIGTDSLGKTPLFKLAIVGGGSQINTNSTIVSGMPNISLPGFATNNTLVAVFSRNANRARNTSGHDVVHAYGCRIADGIKLTASDDQGNPVLTDTPANTLFLDTDEEKKQYGYYNADMNKLITGIAEAFKAKLQYYNSQIFAEEKPNYADVKNDVMEFLYNIFHDNSGGSDRVSLFRLANKGTTAIGSKTFMVTANPNNSDNSPYWSFEVYNNGVNDVRTIDDEDSKAKIAHDSDNKFIIQIPNYKVVKPNTTEGVKVVVKIPGTVHGHNSKPKNNMPSQHYMIPTIYRCSAIYQGYDPTRINFYYNNNLELKQPGINMFFKEDDFLEITSLRLLEFIQYNGAINISRRGILNDNMANPNTKGFIKWDKNGISVNITTNHKVYDTKEKKVVNKEITHYSETNSSYSDYLIQKGLIKSYLGKSEDGKNYENLTQDMRANKNIYVSLPTYNKTIAKAERKDIIQVSSTSDSNLVKELHNEITTNTTNVGEVLFKRIFGEEVYDELTKTDLSVLYKLLPNAIQYVDNLNRNEINADGSVSFNKDSNVSGDIALSVRGNNIGNARFDVFVNNQKLSNSGRFNKIPNTNKYYQVVVGSKFLNLLASKSATNRKKAFRHIFHEQLHIMLGEHKDYDAIIKGISAVMDETRKLLQEDLKLNPNDKIASAINNMLNELYKRGKEVAVEEFLVESMTNKTVFNYLNSKNTESSGLKKKDNIFTKLINLIRKLLGFDDINKNGLIQKELEILSNLNISKTEIKSTKTDTKSVTNESIQTDSKTDESKSSASSEVKDKSQKPKDSTVSEKPNNDSVSAKLNNGKIALGKLGTLPKTEPKVNEPQQESNNTEKPNVNAPSKPSIFSKPLVASRPLGGINGNNKTNYGPGVKKSSFEDIDSEMESIKQKAIADGTFMKAPNGADTKLTEQQWLQVRTKAFKDWFGDWESANDIESNINKIDTSKVTIENKPWKGNENKRSLWLSLNNQPEKGAFVLVKDDELNQYSIHFKTATETGEHNAKDTVISTKEERKTLFKEFVKLIPDGAIISTWGEISNDGIRGLNNVGRDMTKIGIRTIKHKDGGVDVEIPIYQKVSNVSKVVDENGEPLVVYHTISQDRFEQGLNTFEIFDTKSEGRDTMLYFADNYLMSKSYGPVYEVLKNQYESMFNDSINDFKDLSKTSSTIFNEIKLIESMTEDEYRNSKYYVKDSTIDEALKVLKKDYKNVTRRELFAFTSINRWRTILANVNKYANIDKTKYSATRAFFINAKNPIIYDGNYNAWNKIDIGNHDLKGYANKEAYNKARLNKILSLTDSLYEEYKTNHTKEEVDFINNEFEGKLYFQDTAEQIVNKELPELNSQLESTRSLEEKHRYDDYDAVISKNIQDWGRSFREVKKYAETNGLVINKTGNVYAVKTPNQVKSATDNNGDFSSSDNNIYKSSFEDIYDEDDSSKTTLNRNGFSPVMNFDAFKNKLSTSEIPVFEALRNAGEIQMRC